MSRHAARRPVAAIAIIAVGLAGALACGGGDGAPADTPPVDPAGAAPADTASPDTPSPDTTSGGAGQPSLPAWSASEWSGGSGARATQVELRAGRHDGYDRVVLVFADRVPRYTVRHAADRPRQCGSGRPVELTAPAYATVTLEPAGAHDDQGRVTVQDRAVRPELPVLRAATLFCDFEGRVEWVLGLERSASLRVFELTSPARLVVDLRH